MSVRHLICMTEEERQLGVMYWRAADLAERRERHSELERNRLMVVGLEMVQGVYADHSPKVYEEYGDENEVLNCELLIIDDGGYRGVEWWAARAAERGVNTITFHPERWENGVLEKVQIVDPNNVTVLQSEFRNAAEVALIKEEVARLQNM